MVTEEQFNGQDTYKCEVCGFHFQTQENAQACEDYCNTHGGCSSDLAQKALETGGNA